MDKKMAKGFRSLLNGKIVTSVIGTVSLPFIVRVLGPSKYGDYAFLLSTFSLLMIFVSPAVTEGVQKFVAEERSEQHWQERIVSFYFLIAIVFALLGGVSLAFLTWAGIVGRFLKPRFNLLFYFLVIYVVTSQMRAFTRHTLLGLGLERYSESLAVLKKLLSVGIGLSLAAVGFGVAGFLTGHIVAGLTFTILGFFVLRRDLSLAELVRPKFREIPVKTLLSFNGLNIVLVVLMQSLFHTDVLMIRFMTNGQQTGYYKAALVLAEYIWLIPLALQRLMLHSASKLWSQDARDRIQSLAVTMTRYVFLITSLLAIGIVLLADRFVPLYFGANFRATIQPLVYLIPGAVGFALARPLFGINQAAGQLRPLLYALSVSAVLNAALNYTLIPMYGMSGAAIATSTSYGSMFVLQVLCARYLGYSPVRGIQPTRLLGTVVLSAPFLYGFESAIHSSFLALVLVPVVGLCVFTGVALLFGAVTTAELRKVTAILPSPLKWIQVYVFD